LAISQEANSHQLSAISFRREMYLYPHILGHDNVSPNDEALAVGCGLLATKPAALYATTSSESRYRR
jgi:hypothetical protein